MIWTSNKRFNIEPFEREADLETAILEVRNQIFGPDRIYLDTKKRSAAGARFRISQTLT